MGSKIPETTDVFIWKVQVIMNAALAGWGVGVKAALEEGEGKMNQNWDYGRTSVQKGPRGEYPYYILIVWGIHVAHRDTDTDMGRCMQHMQTQGNKIQSPVVSLRITTGKFILRYIISLLYVPSLWAWRVIVRSFLLSPWWLTKPTCIYVWLPSPSVVISDKSSSQKYKTIKCQFLVFYSIRTSTSLLFIVFKS